MEIRRSDTALGLAGLAVLRRLPHDPAGVREAASLFEAACIDAAAEVEPPVVEVPPKDGYAEWAATYDDGVNPMVAIEELAVSAIVDEVAVGRALDAACGTGRHAAQLCGRGWEVVGIDASPEMLRVARAKLPQVALGIATLEHLPLPDDSVDPAVCALAMTHVRQLPPAVRELARVTSPGGTVIITDVHPFATATGAHIVFVDDGGERRLIRNEAHLHSDYLHAFDAADLDLVSCAEPAFRPELADNPFSATMPLLLDRAIGGLPGVVVWRCTVA